MTPGDSPFVLPVLKGRSVLTLAVQLTPEPRPVSDLGGFENQLPPPLDLRLTADVITAHKALDLCSGLSILNRDGDLPR